MRLIDADALEYQLRKMKSFGDLSAKGAIRAVRNEPTIDAVEVRDVAKMLCDMFGDSCACNYNGIDEWLPYVCKYEKSGECPSPNDEYGCWMEFLRNKFEENDNETD